MPGNKNRYVSDYRLHESFEENGKIRMRTEYIGKDYEFVHDGELEQSFHTAILTSLAGWASFAAFLIPPTGLMHRAMVAFPLIFSALPLFFLTRLLVSSRHTARPMQRHTAEKFNNSFPVYALAVCAMTVIAAASSVYLLIAHRQEELFGLTDLLVVAGEVWLLRCSAKLFKLRKMFLCAQCQDTGEEEARVSAERQAAGEDEMQAGTECQTAGEEEEHTNAEKQEENISGERVTE